MFVSSAVVIDLNTSEKTHPLRAHRTPHSAQSAPAPRPSARRANRSGRARVASAQSSPWERIEEEDALILSRGARERSERRRILEGVEDVVPRAPSHVDLRIGAGRRGRAGRGGAQKWGGSEGAVARRVGPSRLTGGGAEGQLERRAKVLVKARIQAAHPERHLPDGGWCVWACTRRRDATRCASPRPPPATARRRHTWPQR